MNGIMGERFYYQISGVTDDGWITIDTSVEGPQAIQALASRYAKQLDKAVWKPYADDEQYVVQKDPFRLTFQYDSMFGSVVILNDKADEAAVIEMLQKLF